MGGEKVVHEKPEISQERRKLLKAAAVAGGAVAAVAALPGEWTKPLATFGVLPAHAQVSGNEIRIGRVLVASAGLPDGREAFDSPYRATFWYEDPLCEIDDTATLWAQTGPCGEVQFKDQSLQEIGARITTDRCEGNISFGFWPCYTDNSSQSLALRLSKGHRQSNTVKAPFFLSNKF